MGRKPFGFNRASFEAEVSEFLLKFGIEGRLAASYVTAFLHRSVLNELDFPESNERLEFLGDAVLELAVTEVLFKMFPDKPEGALTDLRSALVRGKNLAAVASRLGFGDMILLSKGEALAGGYENPYILANTFEAFLGAIYLDLGFDRAFRFIETYVLSTLDTILAESLHVDPKSHLQEICQAVFGAAPEYVTLSETGPDHDKEYSIVVRSNGKELGHGVGSSKKKAQSIAAEAALLRELDWNPSKKKS